VLAALCVSGHAGFASARMGDASPASGSALRAHVEALLQEPDALGHGADWHLLGPEALPVLEQVIADAQAPAAEREQAVTALALVENAEATERLLSLLRDSGALPSLRAHAALALGLRTGPEALTSLLPHLEDPQLAVREAVAVALGRLGNAEAQKALEDRLPFEESSLVREAIQQGLSLSVP
jgi:HEAT repeat protein